MMVEFADDRFKMYLLFTQYKHVINVGGFAKFGVGILNKNIKLRISA